MTDHNLANINARNGSRSIFGRCRPVSSYEKLGRIGEGTYGTVYKAIDSETKTVVALKRIILHNEKNDGFPLTSIREIDTLRRVSQSPHPNCVRLLDVVVGSRRDGVFLVFEYCEHDLGSLLDQVRSPFSESEVKSLVFQLLSAVAFLHDHWIIHRDIKLSNLLYNNRGEVKLADFGLARTFPSHDTRDTASGGSAAGLRRDVPMTLKVVTLWYRAPELLLGARTYNTAIDVWAVGCVLGELLLKRPLLPGDTELDQIHRIFELLGCPSPRIWPDSAALQFVDMPSLSCASSGRAESTSYTEKTPPYRINLEKEMQRYPYSNLQVVFSSQSRIGEHGLDCLNAMLTYDPKQRITARRCLRHLYFSTSPYPKEPDLMPTFPCQHEDLQSSRRESDVGEDSFERRSTIHPLSSKGHDIAVVSESSKHKSTSKKRMREP